MLRSWDRPASEIQGKTVHFGVCSPQSAQPRWRAESIREVSQDPDWGLIKSWLHDCSKTHAKCQPNRHPQLQRIRVVDVNRRILTSLPDGEQYLALSYCWGRTEQPIIGRDTDALPRKLSQTIEDAIVAVQNLGCRYLWADSICIDQRNVEEKHDQIGLMHHIYHGAFATIIVLDSIDADSGIPGISSVRATNQIWAEFGGRRMLSRLPFLSQELAQSLWVTRAWTYQEGLLSHKRIVFTKNQVHCKFWGTCCRVRDLLIVTPNLVVVCNELARSEDVLYPDEISRNWRNYKPLLNPLDFVILTSTFQKDNFDIFEHLVNNYINRQMKKQEDALHAVTGLLQRIKEISFKDGFHYALPLSNFRQALLWTQDITTVGETMGSWDNDTRFARRRTGLPSWSWVGWELKGPIRLEPLRVHANLLPPLFVTYLDPVDDYHSKKIDADRWSQLSEPDQNHKSQVYGNNKFQAMMGRMWKVYRDDEDLNRSNVISPSVFHGSYDSALFIDGIMINLPCKKVFSPSLGDACFQMDLGLDHLYSGKYTADYWRIAVDIFLEEDPFTADLIRQANEASSQDWPYLYDQIDKTSTADILEIRHDFLWISNRMPQGNTDNIVDRGYVVEMSLILLLWGEGIARRGGVVKLKAPWKTLEKLLLKFPPRYTSFFLK